MSGDVPPGEWPPLPGLSAADDDGYEWLLSDHPWAVAERARRRADQHRRRLEEADEALAITARLHDDHDAGEGLHRLADTVERIARDDALRADLEDAFDDETRTAEARRSHETHRRVAGDFDYRYPAHLLGPGAIDHPPPGYAGQPPPEAPA